MIDTSTLKVGDFVYQQGTVARGMVDMITEEGNYVRVQWRAVKRPDILSKSSPLWAFLEKRA